MKLVHKEKVLTSLIWALRMPLYTSCSLSSPPETCWQNLDLSIIAIFFHHISQRHPARKKLTNEIFSKNVFLWNMLNIFAFQHSRLTTLRYLATAPTKGVDFCECCCGDGKCREVTTCPVAGKKALVSFCSTLWMHLCSLERASIFDI